MVGHLMIEFLFFQVYLKPDPSKQTKRKTKVVRKNCNPSFMEMLEYRVPLHTVKSRTLYASVWDCSQFQENMFLGSVSLPLGEIDLEAGVQEKWYPLGQTFGGYRWFSVCNGSCQDDSAFRETLSDDLFMSLRSPPTCLLLAFLSAYCDIFGASSDLVTVIVSITLVICIKI